MRRIVLRHRRVKQLKLQPEVERLEHRHLLTASLLFGSTSRGGMLSGGLCTCPICTGVGLSSQTATDPAAADSSTGGPAAALTGIPQLSSNPNATAKLYLDFDGDFQSTWGSWSNITTPAFDIDGDATSFSTTELSRMQDIWARVAEDYAPFNIDVTTIDPGTLANKVAAKIVIGGSGSWYGSAGGVAYVGGFYNSSSNVGFAFEDNLGNGNAKYCADAASHESGHLFGLNHQSSYSGTTKTNEYNPGTSAVAPLMGNSYSATRSVWYYGQTTSSTTYQDDIAVISGSSNGFGLKADDYGSTIATASQLAVNGTSVNVAGLIGYYTDQDVWSFTTTGGNVSFALNGAALGQNLDAILELRDSNGNLVASSDPSTSLNASIAATLGSGTFYVIARSDGSYGNMGQYTLTGTLPAAASAPEITVLVGSTNVNSGGTIGFGSTLVGTAVDRTVTIRNDGNATLNLTSINSANLPAGYTLVSNIGSLQLAAGATTTFVLRLSASSAGSFSGSFNLVSDDADEGTFLINLSGTVTAPSPEITVLIGSSGLNSGGTLSFGATNVGTAVDKTVTIRNDGNATLNLTAINAANLPAGYSLVSNIGNLQLAAGATTTFVLRLTASTAGSFSGALNLLSDDADEGTFIINLSGSVTAPNPEITVLVGSTNLTSGGTIAFGSVTSGTTVDKTVTVRNDGTTTLTLTSINSANLPAGFSLVSNLASLQLAAGASTTFVLRLSTNVPGSYSGGFNLVSDDADEGSFAINLSGTVTAPTWGNIDFFLSENRQTTGDMWFSANATHNGKFSAESYFDNNLGNVDIEVYNASKQHLGVSNSTTNSERVDVNATAGQQLYIHILGVNSSVTYRCVNLVSFSGDTITVSGTSGDDLLVMLPGSTSHRVAVNGVGYDFNAATYTKIVVQDNGGVDTLVVVGNEQDETADVSQTSTVVNGSAYQLTATGAEFVQLQAGDGNDSATFHDRVGADVYTGTPTDGTLSGNGYSFKATGFDLMSVTFTGGDLDQAFLYGSIGDDHYVAGKDSAYLQGPGFRHEVAGFVTVVGVGGDGNDLAELLDSTGDDIYNGDPKAATLSNASMYLRAELFDRVEARSTGGYDVAYLTDSAGNDAMGASKILAYFNGVGFSNFVQGFDYVQATSTGGIDSLDLYDSDGDDLLTINAGTRRLEAIDYAIQTEGFRTFRAFASVGDDRVVMQNLVSTDKIQGRSNWATLTNSNGRTHTVAGFDVVTAVAKSKQKPKVDVRDIDYIFSKIGF